jgi:hypothetical protein
MLFLIDVADTQAQEVDHALMYGWPHMLCVYEDALLDDYYGPDGGGPAELMKALCKVGLLSLMQIVCA